MLSIEHLRSICSGEIRISEPLARMTTLRVGGPADLYIEPAGADELMALVRYLHETETRFIVLGNGSNVLIGDEGVRGAVLNIERGFSGATRDGGIVDAGAGMRLATFVEFCVAHGFGGVEMLAGIPGTLGGAVIMNAGAYGGEISDHLVDVTVLRDERMVTLARDECGFDYRGSALRGDIVLSARFALPAGDPAELRARRKDLLLRRNAAQPVSQPNAGSIFKNPPGAHAARLIEECGLKGYTVGGARVSELHSNFIVNTGTATAADLLAVINHVRRTVHDRTGVTLELEVELIGAAADALAPLPGAADRKHA